jgi:putative intracellular protease/amidase
MEERIMGRLLVQTIIISTLATLAACSTQAPASPVTAAQVQTDSRITPWQPRAGHARPLVAVLGHNEGTELSDFVLPYGIVKQAGVADVVALGVHPGPVRFRPALAIAPDATMAEFDRNHAEGADYVIVPAVAADKTGDPAMLDWLREQAAKGATIVSICDGALVVARAGLFKAHKATGHWATQSEREAGYKDTQWLKNVRYVADGKVISSAGISAAIPLSLALVEAFGSHDRAAEVARRIGAPGWSAVHDSDQFGITPGTVFTYVKNTWLMPKQEFAVGVKDGVDDLALALTLDVYARTGRSHATVIGATDRVTTSDGLHLVQLATRAPAGAQDVALAPAPAVAAMQRALDDLTQRFGRPTARFVAQQLEYPVP